VLLNVFTPFHVVISLIGVASGFIVVFGLIASSVCKGGPGLSSPPRGHPRATLHAFARHWHFVLSGLTLAAWALYRHQLAGGWRSAYAVTSVIALYFNVFALVAQFFNKVPALKALAPAQSEPPFAAAQLSVLALFVVLGVLATVKFRRASLQTA